MIDLLAIVKDRLAELVTDLNFDDPEHSGTPHAMRFFVGGMPPKRDDSDQGLDVPFCLLTAPNFSWKRPSDTVIVRAEFAIYTATDDRAVALNQLEALAQAVKPVANINFAPYKISGEIEGSFGVENGVNPHPYYSLTLQLGFITPRG